MLLLRHFHGVLMRLQGRLYCLLYCLLLRLREAGLAEGEECDEA